MNAKQILGIAAATLMVATSCQKDQPNGLDGLNINGLAYTPVTETPTTKAINASTLTATDGATVSFDTHQAWFDFTKVSTSAKGRATPRSAWHLGFYSQNGTFPVNGTASNLLAYLNYTVNTQAKLINSITNLSNPLPIGAPNELNNAVNNFFNGGTFGMGDLSTFDFHREGQFVIGTPNNTARSYLIRTADAVQVHPDDPTMTNFVIVSVSWTGSAYAVSYRPISQSGTNWNWPSGSTVTSVSIGKNTSYQSRFLIFNSNATTTLTDAIQPALSTWNLGLSAVVLKRYINPAAGGGAYPFTVKGVVLNNNPAVKVYRIQTTTSADSAGATGPFDPNYNWQNDPALSTAKDISTQFDSFVAANIDDSKFSGNSQEEIGQYYRYLDMGNYRVFVDRFYVIKLQNGDVYKLRFLPLSTTGNSSAVNNGIQIKYAKIATTP